ARSRARALPCRRGRPVIDARPLLADFLVYLAAELQLAPNTVAAYRRDLGRLLAGGAGLPDAAGLRAHLRELRGSHAPASVARATAAIRGFSRFLCAEGVLGDDPAEGLLGARIERRLPKALGQVHVERLLGAIAGDAPLAVRDRALLEALYATGCRVSEVVCLDLSGVLAEHRLLGVRGRGSIERHLP